MDKFTRNNKEYIIQSRYGRNRIHSTHKYGLRYLGMMSYIRKFIISGRMGRVKRESYCNLMNNDDVGDNDDVGEEELMEEIINE